jgi:hydroxymethylbilane synthase
MAELIKIGTRKSPLAMWQAEYVRDRLQEAHAGLEVELVPIVTKGDKILDVALSKVGGKGLFVKELEVQLLEGGVDICVHSTKDMPAELPEGLGLVCFPPRADARDALVMGGEGGIMALPEGAKVGTSSLRRQAQLLHWRPDLEIVSVRGNIQTRMKKVEEMGLECVVLACAGIDRMAAEENIGHRLEPDEMLPAASQGILSIEARSGDERVLKLLEPLDDDDARWRVLAERAFLKTLGGGCQVPIGAYATRSGEELTLRGMVATPDGRHLVQGVRQGSVHEAEALGRALGEQVIGAGGRKVLVEVGIDVGGGEGALAEWTCLVARDEAPDDSLSLALSAQGANVRGLPLMKLDAPEDPSGLERVVRGLGEYDVVAFTSRAAVERFFARMAAAEVDLRQLKPDALLAAVGQRTRQSLEEHGAVCDVVGDAGGAALADAVQAAKDLKGAKVLFPRAAGGREELADKARALGAEVEVVDAYRQVQRDDAQALVQAELKVEADKRAVVITSPRRTELLVELAGGAEALAGWTVVAIGETTAEAAREAGLEPRVAAKPTPSAVLAALGAR